MHGVTSGWCRSEVCSPIASEVAKRFLSCSGAMSTACPPVSGVLVALFLWVTAVAPICAQSPSSNWSEPIDITGGSDDGRDISGILVCDPWQNTHLLWGKQSQDGAVIYYRNDVAGRWSTPIDVIAVPDPTAIGLSAVVSPDAVLHLTWQNRNMGADTYYSRVLLASAGNVRSWAEPRLLVAGGAGMLALSPDGSLHLFYGVSENDGLTVVLYRMWSSDGGLTWSGPAQVVVRQAPVASTLSASARFDAAGRAHIGVTVRSVEYGVYSEVGYVRSADGARTWEPYVTVQKSTPLNSNFARITPYAFGDDEIHLTWHAPGRMHEWSSDGGVTWSQPQEIMPLGAAFGGDNQLVQDSLGVIHVVTGVGGGVYSAAWNGSGWSSPERIEARHMDPHGWSITACGGNMLQVVYDDQHGDNATVWYSMRVLDTPPIARQPIPAPAGNAPPDSRASSSSLDETKLAATPPQVTSVLQAHQTAPSGAARPILLAVGIALLPLTLCVVLALRRTRA